MLWEPPEAIAPRFAVLHLPASLEEMNKSRRMVALQARALASAGGIVALLDPRGTGDSEGEHGAATWSGWRGDATAAGDWLSARARLPVLVWGLRLGALLATDLAISEALRVDALLLWQPVASGRVYFNQFLRIATAQQLTGRGDEGGATKALRTKLQTGETIELAGYDLAPALVLEAEKRDFATLAAPSVPVIWRETTISEPVTVSAAAQKVADRWRAAGADVDVRAVAGPSFWSAQEIAEAPELVVSTTEAVRRWVESATTL